MILHGRKVNKLEATYDEIEKAGYPRPVASPQRAKTCPGEIKEKLPKPENLMPLYLYLMDPAGKGVSGRIIDCRG